MSTKEERQQWRKTWADRDIDSAQDDPEKLKAIIYQMLEYWGNQAELLGTRDRRIKLLETNLEKYKLMNGFKSGDGTLKQADVALKYESQLRVERNRFAVLALLIAIKDDNDTIEEMIDMASLITDYYEQDPVTRVFNPIAEIEELNEILHFTEALELRWSGKDSASNEGAN